MEKNVEKVSECINIFTLVEKSDMLYNYATWDGLEFYWSGVTLTKFWGVKIGKNRMFFGGS